METTFFYQTLSKPYYVVEENRLRNNLRLISDVSNRANMEIILAFKAFALWKTFPIFREYINASTASSLSEVMLSSEYFADTHTYSPAYCDYEIDKIALHSSHLTFNSLSQYDRYAERAKTLNPNISFGLRINPEYSEVETTLYNPCAPGTRFGVNETNMPEQLPANIEGFHCHCHCESGSDVFERTLTHIEKHFSKWFSQIRWINFGGGHLMTRADYDREHLIRIINDFHSRYPHLHIIMEPGSAFAWQTGVLIAQVTDIVENSGIKTAILNVSFTCHMPDCLEMPYMPTVRGAEQVPLDEKTANTYRLGGCSCLAGDFMGSWKFNEPLHVGDTIIFEDMIHYTTVKTNMFNGITHPAIGMLHSDGTFETLRTFDSDDYKQRMD